MRCAVQASFLTASLLVLGCKDDSGSAAANLQDGGPDAKACPAPNTLWETTTVASNGAASHLALAGGRVFWVAGVVASDAQPAAGPFLCLSAPAPGGAAVEIFSGPRAIVALVADTQRVYWADWLDGPPARLLSLPHSGGEPTVLLSLPVTF